MKPNNSILVQHYLVILLLVFGCETETPGPDPEPQLENHVPVIDSIVISNIDFNQTIFLGDNVRISCYAKDDDNNRLIYDWSATQGTNLINIKEPNLYWEPDTHGSATVSVNVRDRDTTVSDSVVMSIYAIQATEKLHHKGQSIKASCIENTTDGGYIILGGPSQFQERAINIIKTDHEGNEEWSVVLDSYEANGADILQTEDLGYLITGSTTSSSENGGSDVLLLKISRSGELLWTRAYGGELNDAASCIRSCSDGGFLLCGNSTSFGDGDFDFYCVRVDSEGKELWSKNYGGTEYDYCIDAQVAEDGGVFLIGNTYSNGAVGRDILVVKTDVNGNEEWHKLYSEEAQSVDYASSIESTIDGNYVITGSSENNISGRNNSDSPYIFLMKIDPAGNKLWWHNLGVRESFGSKVKETPEGNLIILGGYIKNTTDRYGYFVKTDSNGLVQWDILFNELFGGESYTNDIHVVSEDEYAIVGKNNKDLWFVDLEILH